MKLRSLASIGLLCLGAMAWETTRGTAPRSSAELYTAHDAQNGMSIGASLLSKDEARKAIVSEINRCCVVVEVALYPQKDQPLRVTASNFVLRDPTTGTVTKPSNASELAATLQKKAESDRDVVISPTSTIGYQTGGYDPITGGRRSGGVYTSSGVGVGIGNSQDPTTSSRDRRATEVELSEKGLPEGAASKPIAGYLYFPVSSKKDQKSGARQLEYQLNGSKIVLPL